MSTAAAPVTAGLPFFLPETWQAATLPRITAIAHDLFMSQWPPFLDQWYGERYRQVALDPDWLAQSFLANADKEAAGARSLWAIAGAARDQPFANEIARHAADEARHARMYLAMLDLTFPGALTPGDTQALLADYPLYINEQPPQDAPVRDLDLLLDDIVQMNIGEVRTRLHQMLLRPVVMAVAPAANRDRLAAMVNRIYDDEGLHIVYTARILETQAEAGRAAQIHDLYAKRLAEFSALTLKEVGADSFG